jgi:hypothetical protein
VSCENDRLIPHSIYNRVFKDAFAIAQIADLPPDDTIALVRTMAERVFDAIRQRQTTEKADSCLEE